MLLWVTILFIESTTFTFPVAINVNFNFDRNADDACPYFVGRFIKNTINGESPKWLKNRLLAIGLRPISILVDITNFMTFDLCRPLHVFDAAKIKGDLHIRLAHDQEEFRALDGKTYTLDSEMTVISDSSGPEALGGIMGGERSGTNNSTTDIFQISAFHNLHFRMSLETNKQLHDSNTIPSCFCDCLKRRFLK